MRRASCVCLLVPLLACGHGKPAVSSVDKQARHCGEHAVFDSARADDAVRARARALRAAARLDTNLPVAWSCVREEAGVMPVESALHVRIQPRRDDDLLCARSVCDPDVEPGPCLSAPVRVALASQHGVVSRGFDAELFVAGDGALWLHHQLGPLVDAGLRAALHVPDHEIMIEYLALERRGDGWSAHLVYETAVHVVLDAELLGTGYCELATPALDVAEP